MWLDAGSLENCMGKSSKEGIDYSLGKFSPTHPLHQENNPHPIFRTRRERKQNEFAPAMQIQVNIICGFKLNLIEHNLQSNIGGNFLSSPPYIFEC